MQITLIIKNIRLLLTSILIFYSSQTFAEHRFVLGMSGGNHTYNEEEYFGEYSNKDSVDNGELFAEWYFLERLGIGYRYYYASFNETKTDNAYQTETSMKTSLSLATAQIVVLKYEDNIKFGLLGGGGQANFQYKYKKCSGTMDYPERSIDNIWEFYLSFFQTGNFECDETTEERDFSTSGNSTILGAFVDFGWTHFGFRFAYNSISISDLEEYEGVTPALSGTGYYLGLWGSF